MFLTSDYDSAMLISSRAMTKKNVRIEEMGRESERGWGGEKKMGRERGDIRELRGEVGKVG